MKRSHDEIQEMIAAYALGALSAEEISVIRAHILSCDECMAEADRHAEAAAALALTSEPVPLSGGFTEKVLETARSSQEPSEAVPVIRKPRRRWVPVAAASVIALFGLGAVMWSLRDARSDLSRTERALIAVLHSGDAGFELGGTSGVAARVVPTSEGAYLVAVGLREAPANHDYQLWLMSDGRPVSAGVFDADDGLAVIETSADLSQFEGAAVSIEPEGGSTQPTSDPILTG